MNIKLHSDKSLTYVLACSYGPDSMFLFDVLVKNEYKFVVAHVNYHTRKESNSEEENLRKYCQGRNIPIEVLDTTGMKVEGNFEAWARDVRYKFFKTVYKKYSASGLFTAHHLDDHIETFLLQKERKARVRYYGIALQTKINGMYVFRPLLDITKEEILAYNKAHSIPYSIDVTNLSDEYRRNYIRNHVVSKLSREEKEQYKNHISRQNFFKEETRAYFARTAHMRNGYLSVRNCKNMDFEQFSECIYHVMDDWKVYAPISEGQMRELYKNLSSKKPNIEVKLGYGLYYYQEYGQIRIIEKQEKYEYVIERPVILECDEFVIDLTGDTSDRNIKLDDYPITIRTIKPGDKYQISDYEVQVRRLFIDWKMPRHLRRLWPIIVNKDDKIIYIPRYRKNYIDTHRTKFKISLK